AVGDHAAQGADQDYGHRHVDTTSQEQRLQHVVDQAGYEDVDGEDDGRHAGTLGDEDEGDHRERDQADRQLQDAEQQHRQGEQTRARDAHEHEGDAEEQHLDEGDADDTLSHRTDGGGAQLGHL